MNRLRWRMSVVTLGSLVASPAYAVVPPSTVSGPSPTGMSPLNVLLYGSIVIMLCGLFVAAAALIVRLIMELFRR